LIAEQLANLTATLIATQNGLLAVNIYQVTATAAANGWLVTGLVLPIAAGKLFIGKFVRALPRLQDETL
jgi:hypothetical protein